MRFKKATPVLTALALLISVVPAGYLEQGKAQGTDLPARSLALESSEASFVGSYVFQFDVTSATALGSLQFEFCANNPIPFDPCTVPTGFDISAALLTAQSGETGFSIDGGATTANNIQLTRAPSVATPQTVSYTFDPVTNPSNNGSYYVRVYTFATADGSGPTTEDAGIAFAITPGLSVSAYVPPWLEFCVGITVPAPSCASAVGSFVDFGVLSESTVRTGTSQMAGGTNGVGGLAITVIGTTMTAGFNAIPNLNLPTPSNVGTSQFGMNLRNNSSPNVGDNSTGIGTIVPSSDYNLVNQFTFRDGDTIASTSLPTNFNRLTVSYIVNVAASQPPGVYTTTLTYVGTATF